MEGLIKLVAERTGLSEDVAQVAVDTVIEHLKGQLPAPLASQIDNLLSGSGGGFGLEDLLKGLGAAGDSGSGLGLDDLLKGLGAVSGASGQSGSDEDVGLDDLVEGLGGLFGS